MKGKKVENEQVMQEVVNARSDLAQLLEMAKGLTVLQKMVEYERTLVDTQSKLIDATKRTEQACSSLLSYDEREKAIVGYLEKLATASDGVKETTESLRSMEGQILKMIQDLRVDDSKLNVKEGELIGRETVVKEREERMKRLEAFDAELTAKKQQLTDWEKELDSRDRRISDRETHLSELESYMMSSVEKLKDALVTVSSNGVELVNLQKTVDNTLNDAQNRIEKLEAEREAIRDEKKELDQKNMELSQWQKELGLKDDQLAAYNKEVKELEDKKTNLQTEIEQMVKDKESTFLQIHERLEALFKDLTLKVSELEDDVRGRGLRLEDLISREKELESKLKQSGDVDRALKDAQEKLETMNKQIAELETRKKALLDEMHGLETRHEELERLISAARKTV